MDANQVVMLTPVLQYGFAGLCLVLIGVLAWLMARVLQVLSRSSDVIAANTETIRTVEASVKETESAVNRVHEQLLTFSCPYGRQHAGSSPADTGRADARRSPEAPHALAGT